MKPILEKFSKDHRNVWHLLNHMNDGLMITDHNQSIVAVNPSFEKITGYTFEEVAHKNPRFLQSGQTSRSVFNEMWEKIRTDGTWTGELINKRKNGERFWSFITITHIKKEREEDCFYIGMMRDITERKQAEKQITHLAYHDALTQLPNRILFKKQLKEALLHAKYNREKFAVLFLDLDHFKKVNDSLGHHIGDQLLQQISTRLQHIVGTDGMVSRFGGDEFTILLHPLKDKLEAYRKVKRIVQSFQAPVECSGERIYTNTSIGLSFYPEHGLDFHALLKNADSAMYRAKEEGRGQFREYTTAMDEETRGRLQLERELRIAIQKQEFEVYYQLQVNVENNKPYGIEALVRWNHPKKGILSPHAFLPAAEETGLIVKIDDWVLRTACLQTKKWHDEGFGDLVISVNISKKQFDRADFVERVKQIIEETGINPHLLSLEITENMAITQIQEAVEKLIQLKKIGVQLSLDDFGTGYSSLSQLKNIPIDTLKIDKSFIQDTNSQNQENLALVKLIIAMAKSLNFSVICEGVETEEQLHLIQTEGCHHAQGYLFSKPLNYEKCGSIMQSMNENVKVV
ncbi:EAL domain-containing protein [Alkalihalobacterium chitinilyticum]|uniref:EAL domain-containing protein n=1 Tax=Alkalihalobacterium chitinilyticum TaxID=2980103 RepID=A0ABT5VHS2_9BACI|nr:EAL domain-containing protein [Alkalihalobacterium chitinilyticum]MDE5414736.1 EAL domain-containing protein [Alkalihalobacterium chitinilyticum]